MRSSLRVSALLLVLGSLILGAGVRGLRAPAVLARALVPQQASSRHCGFGLEVDVKQGTGAPATLFGFLEVDIDASGNFTGSYLRADAGPLVINGTLPGAGSQAAVTGTYSDLTMNLTINLASGQQVQGTGLVPDLATCTGWLEQPFSESIATGSASGPAQDNNGDWVMYATVPITIWYEVPAPDGGTNDVPSSYQQKEVERVGAGCHTTTCYHNGHTITTTVC